MIDQDRKKVKQTLIQCFNYFNDVFESHEQSRMFIKSQKYLNSKLQKQSEIFDVPSASFLSYMKDGIETIEKFSYGDQCVKY